MMRVAVFLLAFSFANIYYSNVIAASNVNVSVSVNKSAWDSSNNPNNINSETPATKFEYNFDRLPLSGATTYKPWSDSYWPNNEGGLANRWQGRVGWLQIPPSRWRAKRMSAEKISNLSPAEKYDMYVGNFRYPITKSEKARTSRRDPAWEGICHGWAPASYLFQEPKPITVTSYDGISITFASSDIKGLLSLLQGNYNDGRTYMAGNRCNSSLNIYTTNSRSDECLDVHAGAFHVIMANRLGILHKAFVIDRDTGYEVWNQPVHAFRSSIIRTQAPTAGAAVNTVEEMVISSVITYTDEIEPHFYPQNSAGRESFRVDREYRYILELDANRNIIGGKWISTNHPDFLWTQKQAPFIGYFEDLGELYKLSTK
ncbi:MAG: hypothetical protein HQK49_02230 [Oligoflexia bacterium]|nr:hypothetical protein [Oligoflexia bacterium]